MMPRPSAETPRPCEPSERVGSIGGKSPLRRENRVLAGPAAETYYRTRDGHQNNGVSRRDPPRRLDVHRCRAGFIAVFSYLAARFKYPEVLDGQAADVLPALVGLGLGVMLIRAQRFVPAEA